MHTHSTRNSNMEQNDRPKTTGSLNQSTQVLQTRRIPLMNPVLDGEMLEAALHALQSEEFVMGESVHKFEEEFAEYCGARYAGSTGSGTAGVQTPLKLPRHNPTESVHT